MLVKGSTLIVGQMDCAEFGLYSYFSALGRSVISSAREGLAVQDRQAVESFFTRYKPDYVILSSVRSGGIGANQSMPAEFIFENIQAQTNVIDVAYRTGVKKLLYLAASCVYPKDCPQPMKEEYFQTGRMELTSEPYSMAKSAGIVMCQAYRKQYGFPAIVGVPATVYGAGGTEDPADMHVLGSMIAKFKALKQAHASEVTFWGTGAPLREFIAASDLASACLFLLEHYDQSDIINIGSGQDIAIRALAELVCEIAGFKGNVFWDSSKPDGALRKFLDSSRLLALGWKPEVSLRDGIQACL